MKNIFLHVIDSIFGTLPRSGEIELATGQYDIFVHTKIKKHQKVIFEVKEIDITTCGYLVKNHISINEECYSGFKIKARIESNLVKIFWEVK